MTITLLKTKSFSQKLFESKFSKEFIYLNINNNYNYNYYINKYIYLL